MGDRCTGQCCEKFFLPYTKEDLLERARQRIEAGESRPLDNELDVIADMVIPLGPQTMGMDGNPIPPDQGGHYFTCKHYVGGNCSIYETRPKMCRDYPYKRMCVVEGCTWDDARIGCAPRDYIDPKLERLSSSPEVAALLPCLEGN